MNRYTRSVDLIVKGPNSSSYQTSNPIVFSIDFLALAYYQRILLDLSIFLVLWQPLTKIVNSTLSSLILLLQVLS